MERSFLMRSGLVFGLSAFSLTACLDSSVIGGGIGGGGGMSSSASSATSSAASTSSGTMPATGPIDKVDLLISVDNSRSMADKQEILNLAISDLVQSLVNPPCRDTATGAPAATQPASGLEVCPPGSAREYAPILDIHVGVISTSLGGHGADSCGAQDTVCPSGTNPTNNDAAHLLSRTDACGGNGVPTYNNQGFLAWDPGGRMSPPGDNDVAAFTSKLTQIVLGAGQVGCGYESQLESWYRFLVDPDPSASITLMSGEAVPTGVDAALLQQRAAFLRPDSLLAIVMLSDENDCSIKEVGTAYLAAQQHDPSNPKQFFHLPRARQECATNPNDPCCKSCGSPQGDCPADPTCSQPLSDVEDNPNLRCFDQKRRFGFDFLYPLDRYVQGLTSPVVPDRMGDMVPNPLFTDLNLDDSNHQVRDASRVVIAGIVGVPWQTIARDPSSLQQGFKSVEELSTPGSDGLTTWEKILGDPTSFVAPKDPHMVESSQPRAGLPLPTSGVTDPYNGHEYTTNRSDLQYACVFPLAAPRDCSQVGIISCDCGDPSNDNPLCDATNKELQVKAKAYPGLRQLGVLKALDTHSVVSSICPSQQINPAQLDYAYRPAVRALIERVKPLLPGHP